MSFTSKCAASYYYKLLSPNHPKSPQLQSPRFQFLKTSPHGQDPLQFSQSESLVLSLRSVSARVHSPRFPVRSVQAHRPHLRISVSPSP